MANPTSITQSVHRATPPGFRKGDKSSERRHVLGIHDTHCPYGHGTLQSHTGPGTLPLDTSWLPPDILGNHCFRA